MKLPITQKEVEIKESIKNFDITFVITPTGSGKTLLVPKYAHDIFGGRIYVSVPRVPIAKRSAKSANQLIYKADEAGYITGRGSNVPKDATTVYATEGSLLNMIASGMQPKILMLDEAHEQGVLMEALLRKAKDLVKNGSKIIVSSATIDVDRYKKYFERTGASTNVIQLPKTERPFKNEFVLLEDSQSAAQVIAREANKGLRCLVGLSGKREIEEFTTVLIKYGCSVPIFPFHSEIEEEEQQSMDNCKGAMVIVSTNILQSGVTLPQVSVGYFDGFGKAMFRADGRPTLKPYRLSQSEMEQWYGRLGRTCGGLIYKHADIIERMAMPYPEIQRIDLEETVLTLSNIGINIFDADLLNQPDNESIESAVENLLNLGLLDNEYRITSFGRKVLMSGNGIRAGIITVMGRDLGISNTAEKIAAIINIGTPFRKSMLSKKYYNDSSKQSDLLIWKDAIEYFQNEYAYNGKIETHKGDMLKALCEERNIYRRGLKRLIYRFQEIDNIHTDTNPNVLEAVIECVFTAYSDYTDNDEKVNPTVYSNADGGEEKTGNILSIGRSVFFEHVTYRTKC